MDLRRGNHGTKKLTRYLESMTRHENENVRGGNRKDINDRSHIYPTLGYTEPQGTRMRPSHFVHTTTNTTTHWYTYITKIPGYGGSQRHDGDEYESSA